DAAAHVVLLADNQNASSAADRGLEPAVLSSLPVFTYSSRTKPERALLEMRRVLIRVRGRRNGAPLAEMQPRFPHRMHRHVVPCSLHLPALPVSGRTGGEPARTVSLWWLWKWVEEVSGSEPGSSSGCGLVRDVSARGEECDSEWMVIRRPFRGRRRLWM
ncbi:RING-H2 finger protein atl2, partial [Phtheirospermum japonicum]